MRSFFSVAIQVKGTEQYFPLLLFIISYKLFLTFISLWKNLNVTVQVKAIEQHFSTVLVIIFL